MCRHREVLVVEGQPVTIPNRAGCALIAALHASDAKPLEDKPLEDLRRALRLFDDEVWRQAAGLAASVGAGGAFAAALCRESAGAELADRLGLTVTDPVVWFGATSFTRGTCSLSVMLAPGTWADRARRLRDLAFLEDHPRRDPAHRRAGPGRRGRRPPQPVLHERGPAPAGPAGLARSLPRTEAPDSPAPGDLAALPPRRTLRVRAGPPSEPAGGHCGRGGGSTGSSPSGENGMLRSHAAVAPTRDGETRDGGTQDVRPGIAWPEAGKPGRAYSGQAYSGRAARLTLACCRSTCLETALVRQARAARAGVAIDVVVGVTAPASGFRAHAWLDGDRVDPQFAELWRHPARRAGPDRPRRGA